MKLKFGLGFGQDQDVHNVADYAREAERLGYEHITVADINNLANECHVIMTLIAAATSKFMLATGSRTQPHTTPVLLPMQWRPFGN